MCAHIHTSPAAPCALNLWGFHWLSLRDAWWLLPHMLRAQVQSLRSATPLVSRTVADAAAAAGDFLQEHRKRMGQVRKWASRDDTAWRWLLTVHICIYQRAHRNTKVLIFSVIISIFKLTCESTWNLALCESVSKLAAAVENVACACFCACRSIQNCGSTLLLSLGDA